MSQYFSLIVGAVVVVFVLFILIVGFVSMVKAFYVKVDQGTALIKNGFSGKLQVFFTGAWIVPVFNKKEFMKISLITLEVDRRGKDGLICFDNIRADITVAFYLRVNETTEDVLKVAKSVGAIRASDKNAVNELFNAKFSEALKTVGKQLEFESLFENRQDFRDKIVEVIGDDLNGYVLEDVAIDYLEQTPNQLWTRITYSIRKVSEKITEMTAEQNVHTNILEKDEELAITKKNVETKEAMLELQRQEADATARQQREISTIQAREEAETMRVQEEERRKAESANIEVEQDLQVQRENQQREIEVAEKNRQRAVVIEEEKVTRARDLEIVSREREVELQRIEAEKAVEIEKKEIANVIRERVAVDKTVAIEEEKINEVREVSEADRRKQIQVLDAEAVAEEQKVKLVKDAEAQEQSAKHKAVEITVIAEAQLEASAKDADAKKKLAEGVQAEQAAFGLAEAKVQEAKADAMEKEGLAEARVIAKKGGSEAEVISVQGEAEAKATREIGLAEAEVTREHFKAEADGLVDKFEAMGQMSPEAREHEEFRMGLETAFKEAIASIEAGKEIAKENAEVLATALEKAHIDIVGGEAHFFDNFAKSLSIGKAIDGLAGKSETIANVLETVSAFAASKATSSNIVEPVED